jgi:hypothetical protein
MKRTKPLPHLILDDHDTALAAQARKAIRVAVDSAHQPSAVAKKITVYAVRQRNRGRVAARKNQQFLGICEESGRPLQKKDAVLDEVHAEKGYGGKLRWVCAKANHSGTHSCGGC